MDSEQMRVLKLIESGKVSADEGARLLSAVGEPPAPATPERLRSGPRRSIKVRVNDGETKVNVAVPVDLVRVALKFIPKEVINGSLEGVDIDELVAQIEAGTNGKLVEIKSGETEVEVVVE